MAPAFLGGCSEGGAAAGARERLHWHAVVGLRAGLRALEGGDGLGGGGGIGGAGELRAMGFTAEAAVIKGTGELLARDFGGGSGDSGGAGELELEVLGGAGLHSLRWQVAELGRMNGMAWRRLPRGGSWLAVIGVEEGRMEACGWRRAGRGMRAQVGAEEHGAHVGVTTR